MASSELKQRKPQAKEEEPSTSANAGSAEVTKKESAPPQITRASKFYKWCCQHPEVTLSAIVVFICIVGLRFASRPSTKLRLFDEDMLALYNGKRNAPFYLAILGEVFDVTKGRRHYDGSKGYGGFVGRDATRAFVTGDFVNDLNDQIKDLSNEQYRSLVEWRTFYHKEYAYKGRVVGAFYNSDGKPNRILKKVEEGAAAAKSEEDIQREVEAQWPACNVRWTEAEGGTVWCDGGAYPRKIFTQLPGGKPTTRCACFAELGWSDLRQVYEGCKPDASTCRVVATAAT